MPAPVRVAALAVITLLALASCGDGATPPRATDEIEYELFDSTRVLQPADLAALEQSAPDGTLVFREEPEALRGVAVGDVLLAGISGPTPHGLLRVVAQVDRSAGALTLRTAAAPVQLAFRRLHAKVRREVDLAERPIDTAGAAGVVRSGLLGGSGQRSQKYEILVFDGDGDEATTNDQVRIDATLAGGYTYELTADFDWGAIDRLPEAVTSCLESVVNVLVGDPPSCSIDDLLPEAKTTFAVKPTLSADVEARGAAVLDYEKDLQVGVVFLPPYPLGPLVFVPTIDVLGHVEGGASARFQMGASARAVLETSVSVSTKTGGTPQVTPPRLADWSVDVRPPEVDLHAHAEARVGARLNVALFGVAGPYASASAVARIDAAPLEDPCWKVNLALEADLGARITTPRLPLLGYVTLVHWHAQPVRPFDQEVARGTCTLPDDPPPPPGSGPTVRTYQDPPFAPWAYVLGGEVDGTSAPAVGALNAGSPSLVPSIDGRWVAAGAAAGAMHKIDGDGAMTWAAKLVSDGARALRPLRTVPARDGGLVALLRAENGASFVLARTSQAGAPTAASAYALPDGCAAEPVDLVRQGSGFAVVGWCRGTNDGWLVRVDAALGVVRAGRLGADGVQRLVPTAALPSGDAVVVTGWTQIAGAPDHAFVTWIDGEDRPARSTAFTCPERLTIEPSAIVEATDGGVTIVGTANGLGLVARVRADGALGFARFPNVGAGVADGFAVSAVAELPSTGLIIAGSIGDATGTAPPATVLAGLDAGGRTLWARSYALAGPEPRALVWPSLRLTDDGGALVTAIAGPAGGRDGDLVALKVRAKDGFLGDGTPVTSAPLALDVGECAVETRAFSPAFERIDVAVQPIALVRE